MSSVAATSLICTPGKLLSFTAVALNRSPYLSILRGPAFATTHLRPVRPGCQLNRGKIGVGQQRAVRWHRRSARLVAWMDIVMQRTATLETPTPKHRES